MQSANENRSSKIPKVSITGKPGPKKEMRDMPYIEGEDLNESFF
jgi:hypothetical protein